MEIGRRSQVLRGGAWDFLFLGRRKNKYNAEERGEDKDGIGKKRFYDVGAEGPTYRKRRERWGTLKFVI
jgi:hypothetical protein